MKKNIKSWGVMSPDLSWEKELWAQNITTIAGLDEAGRGAWAGPVTAAAVVLPCDPEMIHYLKCVKDSKQLTAACRLKLVPVIQQFALAWSVGYADNLEIDEMGILPATRLAMMRALDFLTVQPDHLVIDALFLPDLAIPQTSLIKGDQRSLSIAAASILAKTARDEWMINSHACYANYQFDRHKGYGTRIHRERIDTEGVCAIHRKTFKPIRSFLEN